MLRLCHFLFQVQVYAVVFVRCIAATPQYTTRLDWQCWPLDVQVFAEFSCSLDGVSYPIANVPRGKIHLSSTDERTTSATWPWSYPAVCTGYVPEADSPLCIFTNTAFDDGRGISFIITPRLAAELASTLTFEDDSLKCSTLFQVAEDAGSKGRSAIIERNITGGEQIAYNMPILVRDWAINKLSYLERENLLCRAILQLPTMTQRLLDGLTSFHNPAYFLSGIVANHGGFTLDMDNRGHSLLFPEMAFFNHDCAPNSQVRIDPTTLSMSVTAARDISEGQEITISYLNQDQRHVHFQPFAERQQSIKTAFHWDCDCSRCHGADAFNTALQQIRNQEEALGDWNSSVAVGPRDALRLIRRYEREGFETFLDIPYGYAALAYNAAGDADEARKYAELAKSVLYANGMPDGHNLTTWRQLAEDPRAHWSWRKRVDD